MRASIHAGLHHDPILISPDSGSLFPELPASFIDREKLYKFYLFKCGHKTYIRLAKHCTLTRFYNNRSGRQADNALR